MHFSPTDIGKPVEVKVYATWYPGLQELVESSSTVRKSTKEVKRSLRFISPAGIVFDIVPAANVVQNTTKYANRVVISKQNEELLRQLNESRFALQLKFNSLERKLNE